MKVAMREVGLGILLGLLITGCAGWEFKIVPAEPHGPTVPRQQLQPQQYVKPNGTEVWV